MAKVAPQTNADNIIFSIIFLLELGLFTYYGYRVYSLIISEENIYRLGFKRALDYSIFMGGLGGVLYCFQAMWRHYSSEKNWDNRWIAWYVVYPLTGSITGYLALLAIALNKIESFSVPMITIATFLAGYQSTKFLRNLSEKENFGRKQVKNDNHPDRRDLSDTGRMRRKKFSRRVKRDDASAKTLISHRQSRLDFDSD